MPTRRLRFLFVGGCREWRPLDGHRAPSGDVWEFRSIPGNVVACGSSEAETLRKLQGMLNRSFPRAGSSTAWYDAAVAAMTDEDKEDERRVLERWFRSGQDFAHADGYSFGQVTEPQCQPA